MNSLSERKELGCKRTSRMPGLSVFKSRLGYNEIKTWSQAHTVIVRRALFARRSNLF